MKLAALIVSILAIMGVAVGVFVYWIGSALVCVDVCPPVSSAGQQVGSVFAVTLGPGLLLTLVAMALTLLAARGEGHGALRGALIASPFVAAIAALAVLLLAGGSLTPVAAGPVDVPLDARQVSSDWMNATRYAVLPLLVWPLMTLVATIASVRRGSSA